MIESWMESNNSKKYSFFIDAFAKKSIDFYDQFGLNVTMGQNFRINNKLSLSQNINFSPQFNNMGYTYVDGSSDINFAKRKVNTIENILSVKYSFTNKMGITFRARHYLSSVNNKEFYILQQDGTLKANPDFHPSVDQNVNFFNIDMVYSWQFAPGSFINIVWKNATEYFSDDANAGYFKSLGNTINSDNNNNLSLKIIYFLDYLKLKQKVTKTGKS